MDGLEFERLVAQRLSAAGWSSRMTPGSSDFGADVICELGDERLVIQCKCYGDFSSVGVDAVREVHSAMPHFGAKHGIVVYRGRPTKNAVNLAKSCDVGLFHIDDLVPGWTFDRTERAERIRSERVRQEQHERIVRHQKETRDYEAAQAEYVVAVKEWTRVSEAHEQWKLYGWGLFIVGALILAGGGTGSGWGWAVIAGGAYCFFRNSPGSKPIPPAEPADLVEDVRSDCSPRNAFNVDATLRPKPLEGPRPAANTVKPGPVHAAINTLKEGGYQVERRHGLWRVSKGSSLIRRLDTDGIVELAAGKVRVRCPACRSVMRVPVDKKLRATCPKCGISALHQT